MFVTKYSISVSYCFFSVKSAFIISLTYIAAYLTNDHCLNCQKRLTEGIRYKLSYLT